MLLDCYGGKTLCSYGRVKSGVHVLHTAVAWSRTRPNCEAACECGSFNSPVVPVPKPRHMKAYRGVQIKPLTFLTSAVHGGEIQLHAAAALSSEKADLIRGPVWTQWYERTPEFIRRIFCKTFVDKLFATLIQNVLSKTWHRQSEQTSEMVKFTKVHTASICVLWSFAIF